MKSFLAVLVLGSLAAQVQAAEPSPEPRLISIFPLGGRAGETLEVEIRGQFLDQVRLPWFYCDQLTAEIIKVEEEPKVADEPDGEEENDPGKRKYRGLLRVQIDRNAVLGVHHFRVVSPAGISNPLRFRVTSETNIREVESPHDRPGQAQPVDIFPAVIQGRLPEIGDVDYYSFQASSGERLCFEIDFFTSSAPLGLFTFRPTLTLYEVKGSWFDPDREIRLAINDHMLHRPTLAYRFARDGEYFLAVGEVSGKPGMDDNPGYQLRIFPGGDSDPASCTFDNERLAHAGPLRWTWGSEAAQALVPRAAERDLSRKIEDDWIERLWSRGVREDHNDPSGGVEDSAMATTAATRSLSFVSFAENEPNDTIGQALDVSAIPAVLEGVIDSPGDVDTFQLKVASGDLLAFEIETPLTKQAQFTPWIRVMSGDGEEIVSNLYKWWGRSGNFVVKRLEAKTLFSFEQGGEFFVQVRDVTSRHGSANFKYRLLVRPQIPHVGAVQPEEDHIQVRPGQASTLDLLVELEEGFQGDVLLSVENLPPGVKAFPAVATEPEGTGTPELPPVQDGKPYRPSSQKVTIALLADQDTLPALQPWFIHLTARPIVKGKIGGAFAIAKLPLVVLDSEGAEPGDKRAALNE